MKAGDEVATRHLPVCRETCLVNGSSLASHAKWDTFWAGLKWDDAWVDGGPSPAGNPGPYLKVWHRWEPDDKRDDWTQHRLYPRWMVGMRFNRTRYRVAAVAAERDTQSATGWAWVFTLEGKG